MVETKNVVDIKANASKVGVKPISTIPPKSPNINIVNLREPTFQGDVKLPQNLQADSSSENKKPPTEKSDIQNKQVQPENIEAEFQQEDINTQLQYAQQLQAQQNISVQNSFIYAQNILNQYQFEENVEIKEAVTYYQQEFNKIQRNYEGLSSQLNDAKKPSKLTFDVLFLYFIVNDVAEFYIVVLKVIAYVSSGGAAAVVGEPASMVADLALDIPIFGYMLLINRQGKKYIEIYEGVEKFSNLVQSTYDVNVTKNAVNLERVQQLRQSSSKDAFISRGKNIGTVSKLNEATQNLGKGTGGSQAQKLQIAEKIISRLKSGPIKKFGKNALRILADFIPIIEAWPFRSRAVYGLYQDFKEMHQELVENSKNNIEDIKNAYLENFSPILTDKIAEIKARYSAAEDEFLKVT